MTEISSGFAAKLAPVFKGPYRVVKVMSDLVDAVSEEDIGVHHDGNLLPFFTWDSGTQDSSNVQRCGTVDVPAGPDLERPEEVEEYGFDFLF